MIEEHPTIRDEMGQRMTDMRPTGGRDWTLHLVVAAVVLALLAAFVAQNYESVEVRLLFWRVNMRVAWIGTLALLIGIVIGWLLPRRRG
jgi:uncharacterized integral membrane protein